ncbi:exodeoxyribonuclease V subunit beta [Salmonella enterica]|nr:exodeoxyribonuclease V subunit beta [Salmonella enterica]
MTSEYEAKLRKRFEKTCAELPYFDSDDPSKFIAANFSRNSNGEYLDPNVEAVWGGFKSIEEQKIKYNTPPLLLPPCPEPQAGWCDCVKCKAMRFHKEKAIYVCLTCHKQNEPLLRL